MTAAQVLALDALGGTGFGAGAAVGALFVVDDRHVVLHLDGAGRTDALAFFAADTAGGANLARHGALVAVAARNNHLLGVGNQRNQVVGAGLDADAAADTVAGVDLRHAVPDKNRVLRTCFLAAAAQVSMPL